MKKIFQKLLPKKKYFVGIDIGAHQIKAAEVKIIDGVPEVVSLRGCPSPPGVWTDQLDEESLVQALKEVANPKIKEVITCIGGERLVSRIVRLPPMSERETEAAVRFEVEKFVPTPVDQLIIRHVRLGKANGDKEKSPQKKIFNLRAVNSVNAKKAAGNREVQNVLLLAVPAATIYQYYSIFSRAGLTVTAVDLQAFALWRLYGRKAPGVRAVIDIGAATSQLVMVKDGLIQFLRLLPVGGNVLTGYFVDTYGVNFPEAQQMKEEAAVSADGDLNAPAGMQMGDVLRAGLQEITKELRRSLEFCSAQECLRTEKLVLSGGTGKLKGLAGYLQEELGIPVEAGFPEIYLSEGETFDSAFAVAVGLALREVTE